MNHEFYLEKLKSSIDILSDILDTENYGMCIVDHDGRIVVWNYERFFHLKASDVLGKPVTEVLENTRLHIVAKTGKKELFQLQKINGTNVIANRIPLMYQGEIIGAAGTIIFKDTKELGELYERIEKVENSFRAYRSEAERLAELCRKSIVCDSSDGNEAYFYRGMAYIVLGRADAAAADFKRCARGNEALKAVCYYNIGTAYKNAGRYSPALEQFKLARQYYTAADKKEQCLQRIKECQQKIKDK